MKFKVLLKKYFRSKMNYLMIFALVISMAFVAIIFSLPKSIEAHWEDDLLNQVRFRTMIIDDTTLTMDVQEKLESIEEINGYYNEKGYDTWGYVTNFVEAQNEEELPTLELQGLVKGDKVVLGETITEENKNEKVMVCPNKYYPYYSVELGGYDKDKEIDLSKYIGKDVIIKSSDKNSNDTVTFKIIGLYDTDNEHSAPFQQTCYTYYKNIELVDKELNYDSRKTPWILIEIDNITHKDKVVKELNNMNLYPEDSAGINLTVAIQSFDTLIKLAYITLFFISFIIVVISFYKAKVDKKNVCLYKLFGYSDLTISKNAVINNLITYIISLILLIPTLFIFLHLFNIYLPKYDSSFQGINIIVSMDSIIKIAIILGILLIISTILIIFSYHKTKVLKDLT